MNGLKFTKLSRKIPVKTYQMLYNRNQLDKYHNWIWPSGVDTFLMDSPSRSNFQPHRNGPGCRHSWWAVEHPGPQGNSTQHNNLHLAGQVHNPDSIYPQCKACRRNHWCFQYDLKIGKSTDCKNSTSLFLYNDKFLRPCMSKDLLENVPGEQGICTVVPSGQ